MGSTHRSRRSGSAVSRDRRAGNDAVHESAGDHRTALFQLRMARKIAVWFHRTFGRDPNFTSGSFVAPTPQEQQAIQETAQQATAEIDFNAADTRRIIDQQLCEAGWEVDSQLLRHRKGTRPVKGRNIGIVAIRTAEAVGEGDEISEVRLSERSGVRRGFVRHFRSSIRA